MIQKTEPKDLLRAARKARYSSAEDAADAIGVKASTLRSYENGTRPITIDAALLFEEKLGVEAKALCPEIVERLGLGDGTSQMEVIGDLVVGVWHDTLLLDEKKPSDAAKVTSVAKTSAQRRRRAYRVADESVNRLFEQGWYAIVEDATSEDPLDYPEDCFLAIERRRNGLSERSIRRVERKSGQRCELACFSKEKRYLGDRLHVPPKSAGEKIIVIGRVVGGAFDIE